MTIVKELYFLARQRFTHLSESDIKLILSDVESIPFNQLALHYQNEAKNEALFFNICEKVDQGYPLQYALGKCEFLGLDFMVDERVLIPRHETEELVLWIEKVIEKEGIKEPKVADICTGSGVIAITIKKRVPGSILYASDLSNDALTVAQTNAAKQSTEITFLQGDSLKPLIEQGIKVDYLVANPPYINKGDFVGENVMNYEPHLALFSQDQVVYRSIFTNIEKVMRTNVITMILEINENEGQMMLEIASLILGSKGHAKIIKDIHDRDRFITVRYHK